MFKVLKLAILLASLAADSQGFAQEQQFITTMESSDLTPAQNKVLEDIRKLSTTGEIQVVHANTSLLKGNQQLTIPLPDRGPVMVATGFRSGISDKEFAVVGRTESDNVAAGQIPAGVSTFAVNGDSVTGSIQTESGLYRIRPLGGGVHVLFKVGGFPAEHPATNPDNENEKRDLPPLKLKSSADKSITEISVLVAYTPTVASKVNDIKGLVDLAFAETNASYVDSGVYIHLVSATEAPVLTNYTESGSFEDDLAALKNPHDGKMDELLGDRNDDKADIVVLLIDNASSCGLASDILGSKESAFAVVYFDCATGNYSFGHEIGHLQGARHNPEVDSSNAPFAYGHGFMDVARNRRSIMSYDCPNHCMRMPEWARPKEWGTADVSNDARVLNETRDLIAAFR